MCCFSPVAAPVGFFARLFQSSPKVHVADTSIFARMIDGARQALVYSMEISVAGEVAMFLPVPIAPGAGESALEFVSLDKHPRFFEYLRDLFVVPAQPAARSQSLSFGAPKLARPKLVVHEVGSFEASFVPSLGDFDRLDERFRLPDDLWRRLGSYDDYGFAVFRLKPGKKKHIHPMAFRFETRDASRLFFPTVHVHDGKVHETADFDHQLYYQGDPSGDADERSFLNPDRYHTAEGMLVDARSVYRRTLRGKLPNRDTWIARAS